MGRVAVAAIALMACLGCGRGEQGAPLKELQRAHSGTLDVVLLSEGESIKQGKGAYVIEFRDGTGGLVDVGTVKISASMAMPGMAPMFGDNSVTPSSTQGRYNVASDLGMAGTWRFMISWDGPAGRGSASLPGRAS
jgi:hypothetical protein